ncbi:MAG TPA: class I SAM-dependent methyltransferase [Actinomycetota bacterium]
MIWRKRFYDRSYRRGTVPWDTGVTPPEVVEAIEGPEPLPPGRALDLGCGTGTNVVYLARHGWEAVGVDFSALAIERAKGKTAGLEGVSVLRGDVTRLSALGVDGPFDLVLDIGCFHGIGRDRRADYVREVTRVARSGAMCLVWAFGARGMRRWLSMGVTRGEMERRFGGAFDLVRVVPGREPPGSAWYTFRKR